MLSFLLLLMSFFSVTQATAPRLSNWMEDLSEIIGNMTILDLALPGTHDTLTYDLSTTVADNANDLPSWASWMLHTFHKLTPFVGDFIRDNAKTQELDVLSQLEAGIRFLDIRTVYTAPPSTAIGAHDWYSLHLVESNQLSMSYFTAIANFLRDHPKEVVVMMLTRHGCEQCTGEAQYPNVSNAQKQKFWKQIKAAFDTAGVGFVPSSGSNYTSVNSTTLSQLVSSNKRALLYAGDYVNFTNEDPLAWDGNYVFNGGAGESVNDLPTAFKNWDGFYRGNAVQRAQYKESNTFYLMSLAGSPPSAVTQYAAEILVAGKLGLHPKDLLEKCAKEMNIPDLMEWCPKTLDEYERLRNFYSQVFLDRIALPEYQKSYSPPGAIYLDVVGKHGEIRTDTQALDKKGFAYVDTLLLWNTRQGCQDERSVEERSVRCIAAEAALVTRRATFPMERWNDPSSGRHSDWPAL